MVKKLHIYIVLLFFFISFAGFATHVVGGSLTYVYNGGSNYTLTLKLYRDCGAGTAALPANVTIKIVGNNGVAFNPSKNVTINLTSVTNIAASFDPCAIPPNPSPCVEEAIYTTTVNNLPPNTGGYHMYFQICCRNGSILNITNPGAAGETYYNHIPGNAAPNFVPNSSPVFTLFPPLFICVNKPFTFNHSATDLNGDSLVYSLYQPYRDVAPTFAGNVATFPAITYVAGYNSLNPLGAGPFSINPTTGLLSGTPPLQGQFVVGVKVKEYRNGVYIGETIRDFQFNVVNCPSPPPTLAVANATINNGCTAKPIATGITKASATWTSISPGVQGAFNNYLACTSNCLTNTVSPIGTPPPFIDFKVCGISTSCNGAFICDTFRVFFNPTLGVNIMPSNPTLCFGQTSTTITAIGSGGTPPYTYLWNNVNPSQTINVGVGTYNVQLSDASGCPPVYNTVAVTAFTIPVTANAGADITRCIQNPIATVTGSVTGSSGGIWSGGNGTYSPTNTTLLNMNYSPTAAELASGSVNLILTTTGNGSCPLKKDTVKIFYVGFTGVITPTITNTSCFGGNNGSATMNLSGGFAPYSYTWTTVPTQTTATISGLPIGTYSITIKDAIGCSTQTTVTIAHPPILSLNSTFNNALCSGSSTGSISITPVGGTSPYTYTWSPGGQTTSSVTSLPIGNYSVNVADFNGCPKTATFTITQPSSITVTSTQTNVTCFNGSNGSVNVSASGGAGSYTYSWIPGGASSPNATGLAAGNYTVIVKDNSNCIVNNTFTITQPSSLTAVTSVTNESCNYLNNGTASVSVSGGTSPYTYSWSPGGQTTTSVTNLASGSYSILATDSKGCTISNAVTVTQPASLTVSFVNQINVSCFSGTNASVSASPVGGTPNYTYSWTPGGTTNSTLSNISIGTYTVTVTDSKSCLTTNTVTITQPTNIVITNTVSNALCNSASSGSINVSSSGGVSPYSYSWLPGGQTTSLITGLPAGNYTVNVTDFNGCPKTATYTVAQPVAISASITQTNVSCFGGNNGLASATVSGGSPTYNYTWTPSGNNTPNLSGATATTYTLNVQDINNCIYTRTVAISQPTDLTIASSYTNETCGYLNNGIASSTVTGGTSPYTYLWSPGALTTASVTGLASGTYAVLVTDNHSCIKTKTISISEPAPLTITFTNQINVSCFGGNNASIGTSITGGTPNYTYTWSPGNQHTASLMNVAAGTYTLNVKDSKGCTTQNMVTITQPTLALGASFVTQTTTCYGAANGSASASGLGGTPSYNYTWTPGNVTGPTLTNVIAGTYSVNIVDSKGCISTKTVAITQPAQITSITTSTSSTCGNANGIASLTVSGGVGSYTYLWSPAGGTGSVSVGGLLAGTYSVLVTDGNGCQGNQLLSINDLGGAVSSVVSTTNVSCFGGNDGAITTSVVGGVAPITFSWSPYGGNALTASNLTAGVYHLTVTDGNGCVSSSSISPQITQPTVVTSNITTSNVACFGGATGSATVVASGGTPSYTYTWLPGVTSGTTVNGLSSNNYSVQIKDSHNCILTSTFSITQPTAALSVAVSSTSITCFGSNNGSMDASASGGTGPYNYTWSPGGFNGQQVMNVAIGNYTINVIDANGCANSNSLTITEPTPVVLTMGSVNSNCSLANGQASVSAAGGTGSYTYTWSPSGGNTAIANGLLAGSYSLEVMDSNNCLMQATQSVADNASPNLSISQTASVSCFGGANGSLTASVVGGTAPFTYTWSPSGGNNQVATNLTSDTYSVIITANNGCTVTAASSLIPQPTQLFSILSTSNVNCFAGNNGSASVTAGGGIPAYTYSWLPGATTGTVVSNLSSGNYSVQITDANNCVLTTTYSISQPTAALSSIVTSTAVLCFGGNTGLASVNTTGGTAPYNYNWLPMAINSPSIGGLTTGIYTVNVSDSKNCTTSTTINVSQPTQSLSATANGVGISCSGGSNGTATVTPIGGTGAYSYQWSPSGGTGQTATGLIPGTYFINVNDVNNCSTNVSVIISSPTPITGSLVVLNPACSLANGSITSQISGGTTPYTYSWSPGSLVTPNISGVLPGIYTLQTFDAMGCINTLTTSLTNIPGPAVTLVSALNDSCYGDANGSATININAGTPPYTITWLPFGANNTSASQLTAGIYTANVVDDRGCINSITATITEPNPLSVSIGTLTNVSCFGGNNGSISLLTNGGTPAYSYSWTPLGTGATQNNLSIGGYTVTVKDSHLCSTMISMSITEPSAALTSSISSVVTLLCHNSLGSASTNVAGGTIPYTYTWTTTPPQNGSTANNILAGTYTVNIEDANGCSSSNTVTLTQPSDIFTNSGINDTICLGQSGTLIASATGGAGNYYYVWQPLAVTNSGTLTTNPISNTNYTVVAFDQNGCSGLPDTAKIVVYSLSPSNLQTFGQSPICLGQSPLISALVSGNPGPVTYNWSNSLGTGPGPYIVTPVLPITYYVTVTNSCGVSVIDSVEIAFNPPPTIAAAYNGTLVCVPGSLSFLDNSVTGNQNDPITSWLWNFGDGTSSTEQNPSHNYTTAGTYSVSLTVTTDAGCTNNNTSGPIVFSAYPYPVAQFSVNTTVLNLPYDVLVCTNQSTGATTYNWNFGDGSTSTEAHPNYNYTTIGNFQIQLIATSPFGCTDTTYQYVVTDADVVFPNAFTPNSNGSSGGYYIPGSLNNDIFFPYTSGVVEYKFQIFDRWGELIFETEDVKQGWDGYYRDKLCQLGVYVWKARIVLNNGKKFNKKGDVTLLR